MTDAIPLTYRQTDAASKLLGLALIAAGMEAGLASTAGGTLAVAGIALGTITVFIDNHE